MPGAVVPFAPPTSARHWNQVLRRASSCKITR